MSTGGCAPLLGLENSQRASWLKVLLQPILGVCVLVSDIYPQATVLTQCHEGGAALGALLNGWGNGCGYIT